jgi:hypothetical protein
MRSVASWIRAAGDLDILGLVSTLLDTDAGETMMDQPGRLERRQRGQGIQTNDASRNDEKSNSYPYVMIALGLAFVGFGTSVGLTAGELVPFFVFMFPASVLLALGLSRLAQQRRKAISPKVSKERELLSAIQDNSGSITPAEAAMQTSLTVGEADEMLSELASGGHLRVESSEGTLFYRLPGRHTPELESRHA